jgi:hypothetical protein
VADSPPGSGVPAGSDVMSVYTDSACQDLAGGSSSAVATYTTTTPGTYYVKVFEGSGGADGGFTLTASAS